MFYKHFYKRFYKFYKYFATTNILLLRSMVGILKSVSTTNILLLQSMVGILKSVSTNILHLRSMVENSKFVATTNILFLRSIGCVYIYSIPWNYIYVARLRRSLLFVTTIITIFKVHRRYAIFVILNL